MKKLLLFITLLMCNCILESCLNCGNIDDICFDLDLTSAQIFDFEHFMPVAASDTIELNRFGILLEGTTEEQTCWFDFSLGGSLHAEDCNLPTRVIQDEVINISIISNNDLSTQFKAGVELKELFTMMEFDIRCLEIESIIEKSTCLRGYTGFSQITTLEAVFNRFTAANLSFADSQHTHAGDDKNVLVLEPDNSLTGGMHIFELSFEFASGKLITLETDPVFLQ